MTNDQTGLISRCLSLEASIELLAESLSEVNSTIREFTTITRQQGNAIQELITLAQQQQANSAKQQEAIDRLLARN